MGKPVNKRLLIAGILVLVLVLLSPCFYGLVLEMLKLPHRLSWRDRTSPLTSEVIQDLCQNFNLSEQDPRCEPGAVVYAPDFFQTIRNDFFLSGREAVTFDYVQEKLGRYQYACSPMIKVGTGEEYFRCSYDLQGDRVYPIGISFYSNGKIWRYFASTSD